MLSPIAFNHIELKTIETNLQRILITVVMEKFLSPLTKLKENIDKFKMLNHHQMWKHRFYLQLRLYEDKWQEEELLWDRIIIQVRIWYNLILLIINEKCHLQLKVMMVFRIQMLHLNHKHKRFTQVMKSKP